MSEKIHLILPTGAADRFASEAFEMGDLPHAAWARESVDVPSEFVPLRLRRTSASSVIQHFSAGPAFDTRIISTAFRDLIEEFDPGINTYVPVEIELSADDVVKGEYWLLKTRRVISAVNPDPRFNKLRPFEDSNGDVLGIIPNSYLIIIQGRAFEGLHFWRDAAIQNRHFCSDVFRLQIRKRRLEPVRTVDEIRHIDDDNPMSLRDQD